MAYPLPIDELFITSSYLELPNVCTIANLNEGRKKENKEEEKKKKKRGK